MALAHWLAEETPEDRMALERLQEERRRERLRRQTTRADLLDTRLDPQRLTTVSLHLRNPESLVWSAEKLGYRLEPVAQPSARVAEQPLLLLRRPSGERLAIARNARGRVIVQTAGDRSRVQALVRQHTLDRTLEHLGRRGMNVQTATLANGEVQILAREQNAGQRGGAAEIKAQVHTDGTTWVDVDCVRGTRCEAIVSELAQAIGGEVANMTKKNAYYQLPGEPTKVRQQV